MGHEVGSDEFSRLIVKRQAAMPSGAGEIDHGETADPGPFFRGQLVEAMAGGFQGLRIGAGSDLKETNDRARKEDDNQPNQHENDFSGASNHTGQYGRI